VPSPRKDGDRPAGPNPDTETSPCLSLHRSLVHHRPADFLPIRPRAPPPKAVISDWESWEGFRFTFLRHFPRPEDVASLRGVAQLLYELTLENPTGWPELSEPETRWELVAALSELQFLESYLTSVFEEHRLSSLRPSVEELSRFDG
jgi:hypothetical protein